MPLLILFIASSLFAQSLAPEWVNESWQASHYPKSEWYTGFAAYMVNGQPDSEAYQAVEQNAQGKLSESIIVRVQSTSNLQTAVRQTQKNETINKNYDQNIRTASNAVLTKVETRSYFDKKSSYIYGFAAVKKKDLADFYRSGISSLFSFAEKEFALAEQQAGLGKKKAALDKIRAIEDSLKNVAYWSSLLQAVESDNSYFKHEQDFWQRAGDMKIQLQNGTSVYLDISGYSDLEALGAKMQEKGCNCSIAEAKEDADYWITIKTKLNNCNKNNNSIIYCYANANATVNNQKYKKPVNISAEAKGGWVNGDKAIEETFKELTNSIAEKIIQTINQ